MSIKVKVNLQGLNSKLGQAKIDKAYKAATNDAYQLMNKYVPSASKGIQTSGTLRGMSYVSNDGKSIVYNAQYAKAQFYGIVGGKYPVRHYTTPGTSKRWDLRLKGSDEDMKRVKEAFINELKRDD